MKHHPRVEPQKGDIPTLIPTQQITERGMLWNTPLRYKWNKLVNNYPLPQNLQKIILHIHTQLIGWEN